MSWVRLYIWIVIESPMGTGPSPLFTHLFFAKCLYPLYSICCMLSMKIMRIRLIPYPRKIANTYLHKNLPHSSCNVIQLRNRVILSLRQQA